MGMGTSMMPLRRHHDWERRLGEYLDSKRDLAAEWGKHDCALFACGAIEAITGADLAAGFRGKYDSERAARKLMRAFAGGLVAEVAARMAAEYYIPEVPPLCAQRGDIALADTGENGLALSVVALDGWRLLLPLMGDIGFGSLPLTAARKAWRVGE